MYQATRRINEVLKQATNFKVFTDENEKNSSVWVQFAIDNGPTYRIKFISTDDDNDVAVRVFSLVTVAEDKRIQLATVLNELNGKFRFVKFYIDSDGGINVEYDYPLRSSDPSESAEEMIVHFVKIIDDAYPVLMRAMWS